MGRLRAAAGSGSGASRPASSPLPPPAPRAVQPPPPPPPQRRVPEPPQATRQDRPIAPVPQSDGGERSPGLGPHQPPCFWARCLMAAGVPRPGPYKSFAPRQLRPPNHPAAAGAQRHQDDHDLPANGSKRDLEGGQKPAGLAVRKSKVQSLKSKVGA